MSPRLLFSEDDVSIEDRRKKEFMILQTYTGSKTRSQFVTQPDDNKPKQEFKAQGRENWLLTFKSFCFPKIAARK